MSDKRIKTDIRVAPAIAATVADTARRLGVSRNAVHTMSVALFAAQMSPLLGTTRKRKAMLEQIERELKQLFDEAKGLA